MALSPFLFARSPTGTGVDSSDSSPSRRSVSPNQLVWDRIRSGQSAVQRKSTRRTSSDGVLNGSFIDVLPTELCVRVFLYLSLADIGAAAQVCREWRRFSADKALWKALCKRRWVRSYWGPHSAAYTALEESLHNDWRTVFRTRLIVERRWATGECRTVTLPVGGGAVDALQFDDALLAVGTSGGDLLVWDIRSGLLARAHSLPAMVSALALEPGGVAAVGLWSGLAALVDLDSGDAVATYTGHAAGVRCVALLDALVVTGGFDATVRVWDRLTGAQLAALAGHTAGVTRVVCAAAHVFSSSLDGTVRVWAMADCSQVAVLTHPAREGFLCLAADDARVVAGAQDGVVYVWHADHAAGVFSPAFVLCVAAAAGAATALAVVGARAVVGYEDGVVRVWALDDGRLLSELRGHLAPISALEADDTKIVSGSADAESAVRIWDFAYDCANVDSRSHVLHAAERAAARAQSVPGDEPDVPDAPDALAAGALTGALARLTMGPMPGSPTSRPMVATRTPLARPACRVQLGDEPFADVDADADAYAYADADADADADELGVYSDSESGAVFMDAMIDGASYD